MFKSILHLFFFIFLITHVQVAMAMKTNNNSTVLLIKDQNIVENYPLTEDFLSKIERVIKEIEALPPELNTPNIENDNSIEGLTAFVSSLPQLSNILKKNNLTPKDYVIGTMALKETLTAIIKLEDEEIFSDKRSTVSLNNLKFGKKHIDRIRAILMN
ncbi:hypothetical protein [Bartonella sp. B17]